MIGYLFFFTPMSKINKYAPTQHAGDGRGGAGVGRGDDTDRKRNDERKKNFSKTWTSREREILKRLVCFPTEYSDTNDYEGGRYFEFESACAT